MSAWLITSEALRDDLLAFYDFPGQFLPVNGSLSLKERFSNIRANYRRHQAMVDADLADWFDDDPYELGDWLTVFTPIEFSMWQDIRCWGWICGRSFRLVGSLWTSATRWRRWRSSATAQRSTRTRTRTRRATTSSR